MSQCHAGVAKGWWSIAFTRTRDHRAAMPTPAWWVPEVGASE
jgi:hypothetical protein